MFLKFRTLACIIFSIIACIPSTQIYAAFDPRAAAARVGSPIALIECCICLEEKDQSAFVTFSCNHSVCSDCTKKSTFKRDAGCPQCRAPLKLAECGLCKRTVRTADQDLLDCKHIFHSWCINPIIYRDGLQASCPVCKKSIQLKSPDGSDIVSIPTAPPTPLSPSRPKDNPAAVTPKKDPALTPVAPKRDKPEPSTGAEDTDNEPKNWTSKKTSTPAFLAQEIGAACVVGALARAAWLKFGSKSKSPYKRTACAAVITVGVLGVQKLLSYTNPRRYEKPDLALTSWLVGFTAGVFITDLIEKYMKKPAEKK